jgi:ATP-binding cassette subfamily C (CFTR/MRP) protein 1
MCGLETLTGLSTIRAYSKQVGLCFHSLKLLSMKPIFYQESSVQKADQGLDMQNRAYLMTVSMQRWLAIRLDFFGNILVLGIALFGAATSKTMNPARTSVVLSYTLGSK